MSEWKPIVTAPRNESVLLWDGEIHEGFWDVVDSDNSDTDHYGWNYGMAKIDATNFNPTHWMPRPEPPK